MGAAAHYATFAEFERDEIRPMQKCGFSIDDLEDEATFRPGRDDSTDRGEPEELDFG